MLDAGRESLVSSAGGLLLRGVVRRSGLAGGLSSGLSRWRPPGARHDPGKIITDLAMALVLGGDCLADIAAVRAQPELFGPVASDPTVSRLIHRLAADVDQVLEEIAAARQAARTRVWSQHRPIPGAPGDRVIIDPDATLVGAHSDKEGAQPTYKRGFGFHPFLVSVDHGPTGTGEMLAGMLRPGKAAANAAADHIRVTAEAIAALPEPERARVLVRTDSAGGTKAFLGWLTAQGLEYSVGFPASASIADALERIPRQAWRAAVDGDGKPRPGAQVAELTDWLRFDTSHGPTWPDQMRVIVRRERPHPGAPLRLTDPDGWRIICFATNTKQGRLADLEVRHRQRARAEDRIKDLKDLGLANLPFHSFAANQIWLAIVYLAHDLLTWTQTLALTNQHPDNRPDQDEPADHPRRWEPKRLRYRLLAVAGRIITTGRRHLLRLPRGWPWNHLIDRAWQRLQTS